MLWNKEKRSSKNKTVFVVNFFSFHHRIHVLYGKLYIKSMIWLVKLLKYHKWYNIRHSYPKGILVDLEVRFHVKKCNMSCKTLVHFTVSHYTKFQAYI